MTGNDEAISERAIELCRNLNRRAADAYVAKGISREDVSIAAVYSAFDVVEAVHGPGIVAIEWIRSSLDLMERQLLTGKRSASDFGEAGRA